MLGIKGLDFRYGKKGQHLFQGLDLDVQPGRIYGLLGKNGAGKTTLLKLMAGLLFPLNGTVALDGVQIGERRAATLADLYFLPDDCPSSDLSPLGWARLYSPFYPRFDQKALETALKEFEVEPGVSLNALSHGQKKKFHIAFALASGARLCLMDEPTNGLDIPAKSQFRRLIAGHAGEDRTFIISTHQVRDLEGLIDPVVIVEGGKVVFNQERWKMDENLVQTLHRSEAPVDSLYQEKVLGGWLCLQKAPKPGVTSPGAGSAAAGEPGSSGPGLVSSGIGGSASGGEVQGLDLEFLFNAVVAGQAPVQQAIEEDCK